MNRWLFSVYKCNATAFSRNQNPAHKEYMLSKMLSQLRYTLENVFKAFISVFQKSRPSIHASEAMPILRINCKIMPIGKATPKCKMMEWITRLNIQSMTETRFKEIQKVKCQIRLRNSLYKLLTTTTLKIEWISNESYSSCLYIHYSEIKYHIYCRF